MALRLENAKSYHPSVQFDLSQEFLSGSGVKACQPAILVKLPPAVLIDPNELLSKAGISSSSSSQVHISSFRYLNSTHPSLNSYDFNRVDLENAVGYSGPSKEQRDLYDLQRRENFIKSSNLNSRDVKRVRKVKFVVASSDTTFTRYQDVHGDVKRPLAKETRAVLISLKKRKNSKSRKSSSLEADFDELTGARLSPVEAVIPFDLPLQLRYVSPIISDLSFKSMVVDGNFEAVNLDKPELIQMCLRDSSELASDIYEHIAVADLLPSPHSHLTLQLTPHENQWVFYRLKMEAQNTPYSLSIPAGNASLAAFVQIVTFASLLLAAIWTIIDTQSTLSKLRQSRSSRLKTSS